MFKLVGHSVCTLAAVLVVNETMALVLSRRPLFSCTGQALTNTFCYPNAMQDRKIDCTRQRNQKFISREKVSIHLNFIIIF